MDLKKELRAKVLLGLLGAMLWNSGAVIDLPTASAAKSSLYEEYRAQNEAKSDGRNVERSVPKKEAAPSVSADDPNAFTARIQRILDEWPTRNYSFGGQDRAKAEDAPSREAQAIAPAEAPAAAKAPVPTPAKPRLAEGRYDFDWRGTPLSQSLYAVAKIAGKGVVVNGDLKGNVFISLKQSTCNQALDYLSRAFDFNWQIEGNNIIISTSELMKSSKVFEVHYIDKAKVKAELQSLGIEEGSIYANTETGTVSVTGTPYQLMEAERRIERLDHPVAQCLLVAQLVEISHGKSLNLGVQYSLPTYSHTGTTDGTTTSASFKGNWLEKLTFSASASASRELSKGHIIARPMIMALNGEEGTVQFGDQVPVLTETATTASTSVTVTYHDVGTLLKMTPIINTATGDVTLKINAEVSNITSWVTSGQTTAPQISMRKSNTSAHLKSGQSLVIGGLMSVNELDNLSGIPGLMNLPILGKLFSYHSRSKSYSEIFIMITPYIVSEDINPEELLKKVEG